MPDRQSPMIRRPISTAALLCMALTAVSVHAQSGNADAVDAPMIAGGVVTVRDILPDALEAVPGSTFTLSEKDLEAQRPFTVVEALRTSPGINVVGEDAFGLNLNVGMRGLNPRRSSRTMMLEDGAPIHLAPYGDPASHYSPPMERVGRIDVLRGSGQIVHGPQTVGGVINLVSKPVPRQLEASGGLSVGNRSFRSAHASVGSGGEWGGLAIDVLHKQGDGTREKHKHEVNDVSLRGELDLNAAHSVFFKLSSQRARSNITEAGLDQARYSANPYANPFNNDVFEFERDAAQAIYRWQPRDGLRVSTNVYYQKVFRASYRQIDDSTDEMTANAATGCTGAARRDYENFADRCGNKMRPRTFEFYGIEPRLDVTFDAFGVRHEAIAGLRLHNEDVTRQRYNGLTPNARENSPGTVFRDSNEIDTQASSFFVQNTAFIGDWTVTPGVRVERIKTTNRALRRNNAEVNASRTTEDDEVLPGIGVTWFGLEGTTVFAGVHKGFAPSRPDANLDPLDSTYVPVSPEKSTNYELGFRTELRHGIHLEATLFHIDFENQIVSGSSVGLPQTFANAGKTRHAGLELGSRIDLGAVNSAFSNLYATVGYTNLYTAQFDSNINSGGQNINGNRLPYAPRHMLNLGVGYQAGKLNARLGVEYISKQFSDDQETVAGSANGRTGLIPSQTTVNFNVNYRISDHGSTFFFNVSNLMDKKNIVSRVDGLFVGRPRTIVMGLRWNH